MQALSPVGIAEFDFPAGMIVVVVVVQSFAKKVLVSRASAGAVVEHELRRWDGAYQTVQVV